MKVNDVENWETIIGLALYNFNKCAVRYLESVLPFDIGKNYLEWCSRVRKEIKDTNLTNLDTNSLIDIFLAGWDEVFHKHMERNERQFFFDVRRYRNKWAHQTIFTSRDAYRIMDIIYQILSIFNVKTDCKKELEEIDLYVENIILAMANRIIVRREHGIKKIYHGKEHVLQSDEENDSDVEMIDVDNCTN